MSLSVVVRLNKPRFFFRRYMLTLQVCNGEKAAAPKRTCMCHGRCVASRARSSDGWFRGSVAVKTTRVLFAPRAPLHWTDGLQRQESLRRIQGEARRETEWQPR